MKDVCLPSVGVCVCVVISLLISINVNPFSCVHVPIHRTLGWIRSTSFTLDICPYNGKSMKVHCPTLNASSDFTHWPILHQAAQPSSDAIHSTSWPKHYLPRIQCFTKISRAAELFIYCQTFHLLSNI